MRESHNKTDPALEIRELKKAFGSKLAVNNINLSIPVGSFYGLVGPNGAGKTTTLSMVTGLLRPDAGNVHIFGIDMWRSPVQAKELIGVLPDGLSLPERLTGRELLTYLGLLRGQDYKTVTTRTDELLHVLDLTDENTLVIDYSTGMRKKIALASALLHNPKLLILDEPFEAVDPISANTIKTILKRFVSHGGTIIFSSHVMATVEQLCDTLAIVSNGTIKAEGSMDNVLKGKSLEKRFVELVGAHSIGAEELPWLTS